MIRLMTRLDYLCVEIIGKNIDKYRKIPKGNWRLRSYSNYGEKLILACLSNSFQKGINENSYEFILNNFYVKNLKIFPKLFEKIRYFDFLNEKYFDVLEIELERKITLKNIDENFQLTTNKLSVTDKKNSFLNSKKFFSNLHVKNNIEIWLSYQNDKDKIEMEELLLLLLENTSKEIEDIYIQFHNPSENFIKKYLNILTERTNLKNLNIRFNEKLFKRMPIVLLESTLNSNYHRYLESIKLENINCYSTENLEITCDNHRISYEKVKEYFSLLNSLNLKNIKSIKIDLIDYGNYSKEFSRFFEMCSNLEFLQLKNIIYDNSILYCSNTLKKLHLISSTVDLLSENEYFKNFLSKLSLKEVFFHFPDLNDQYFSKIIEPLGTLRHTLTSLTISCNKITGKAEKTLPNVIAQLYRLNCFRFGMPFIEDEVFLSEIFKGLQTSCQTLEIINIAMQSDKTEIQDCNELLELLDKCKSLTVIDAQVWIKIDKIPHLLSKLTKLSNTLEVINIDFCYDKRYNKELIDFLSLCSRLKNVYGNKLTRTTFLGNDYKSVFYHSKYSLRYVGSLKENFLPNSNFFPNMLTSSVK